MKVFWEKPPLCVIAMATEKQTKIACQMLRLVADGLDERGAAELFTVERTPRRTTVLTALPTFHVCVAGIMLNKEEHQLVDLPQVPALIIQKCVELRNKIAEDHNRLVATSHWQ